MGYVGKVSAGGSTHLVGSSLYGTCSTDADVVAKVVTLADFTSFMTGITIHVKMANSNTATDPTLNVNSKGAKAIKRYGSVAPGVTASTSWNAGSIVSFTYDGTNWIMNDWVNSPNTVSVTAGTAASLTTTTHSVPNVTSAGSAASLTTTTYTVPNVTNVGTTPSLTTTTQTIPNVTGVGTAPSLTITSTSVVNSVSGGTASVSNGTMTLSDVSKGTTSVGSASGWSAGSTPTLGTAFSVKSVSTWSEGTTPTLGTAFSIKGVDEWSAGSAPTLGTAISIKGVNAWTANTPTAVSVATN